MIAGTGIDIIEIARIERLLEKSQEQFLNRIYTPVEQAYCNKMARRAANYAARFAAKEAFVKAIGTGFSVGITWTDVGIQNDESGMPRLIITGKALEIIQEKQITRMHVSISHCNSHATAFVVLERD